MDTKYEIKQVYIKAIDFTLKIIEVPKEDTEENFAFFTKENGLISKDHYNDYLLAYYVTNINEMLQKISEGLPEDSDFDPKETTALREYVIKKVLDINPHLKYDNIVISENGELKLRENCPDCLPLPANPAWLNQEDVDEDISVASLLGEQNPTRPVEELKFDIRQIWWKRLNRYVSIKKFDKKDLGSILSGRTFQSRTTFATFIVSLCVEDFEGICQLLDAIGVAARVTPPLLVHELHELCLIANPFLNYETVQEIIKVRDKKNEKPLNKKIKQCNSCGTNKKETAMGDYVTQNKEQYTFNDVPKDLLLKLGSKIKEKLIGQDEAVNVLVEAIQRARVGLKNPDKPIGSFLFAGRTGCGKSLASKVLAEVLIPEEHGGLITIDCSEYAADHEYSKLIGSPPGYLLSDQGGILTNAVLKNPFSVVVFDEIEKASEKVYQLLLQVLEEGRLTDNKGNIVPFKDTVVILTSNIGAQDVENIKKTIGFGNVSVVTEDKKEHAIKKAIKKKFKPEFLNRLDEIIYFADLTKEDYQKIIELELERLNTHLSSSDSDYNTLTLKFDDKIKSFIYDIGVDPEYGARPIKRAIERSIATPLAIKLLSGKVEKHSVVFVSSDGEQTKFRIHKPIKTAKEKTKTNTADES